MPRMTDEEYSTKSAEILSEIPQTFHSFVSMQAYDRGHSAGYEEVIGIMQSLVYDLKPAIAAYTSQIKDHKS